LTGDLVAEVKYYLLDVLLVNGSSAELVLRKK
jgi:hypothetical protein